MIRHLTIVLLAVVSVLSGCATTTPAAASKPEAKAEAEAILRIGVSRTAEPMIYRRRGQTLGLEADFAEALAAKLGRKYRFVPMFWPNLIPELQARRIDIIMSAMSVTPERAEVVTFSEPYMSIGQKALIRKKDSETLWTNEAILATDRRVGVETGTTAEAFARENLPKAKRFQMATVEDAVKALRDERVDIVIHDSPMILMLAERHKEQGLIAVPGRFNEEQLAWAVNRFNRELLGQVNEVLREWKQSGKLDEMIGKWVPKE